MYAAQVSLAVGSPWSCMPKWQYGDIIDFITYFHGISGDLTESCCTVWQVGHTHIMSSNRFVNAREPEVVTRNSLHANNTEVI